MRNVINIDRLKYQHELLKYLSSYNIPVAEPLEDPQGSTIFSMNENIYIVSKFINGHQFKATKRQIYNTAKLLARYHNVVRKFEKRPKMKNPVISSFSKYKNTINNINKILNKYSKIDDFDRLVISKMNMYQKELKELDKRIREIDIQSSDILLVHGDFTTNNVLYRNDEIVALLDFEHTHFDWKYLDIVRGVDTFNLKDPNGIGLDIEKANIFLKSYSRLDNRFSIDGNEFLTISKLNCLSSIEWSLNNYYIKKSKESLYKNVLKYYTDNLEWRENKRESILKFIKKI